MNIAFYLALFLCSRYRYYIFFSQQPIDSYFSRTNVMFLSNLSYCFEEQLGSSEILLMFEKLLIIPEIIFR